MMPITTARMVEYLLLGERGPICYWRFAEVEGDGPTAGCRPGDCGYRPPDPAARETMRMNRELLALVGPLAEAIRAAAARNAVVKAHVEALRAGDHRDLTAALVGMVGGLVHANALPPVLAVAHVRAERPGVPQAWTAERPTTPGYYWLAEPGRPPAVVELGRDQVGAPAYYVTGRDDDRDPAGVPGGSLWCGPLDPPPVPHG